MQDKPTQQKPRTETQSDSLFLWYSQIEKICENEGVTWDRLVRHTHQLRVTKANLHEAGKQLQKALWGKTSTKELEKTKQIEILVQHFADWFGKEGIEVPPFPSQELKHYEQMSNEYRV